MPAPAPVTAVTALGSVGSAWVVGLLWLGTGEPACVRLALVESTTAGSWVAALPGG